MAKARNITARLAGRIALVTGASRGIGAAVARRFAEEGAHVILTARTVGGLEAVHSEIKALGRSATLVPLDLRKFDEIDRMGAALDQRFGKLDIFVANAGVFGTAWRLP
jgi:NAD(P)-dependent dehydrogenase (short-subunit alcohol dehydrogenase family)